MGARQKHVLLALRFGWFSLVVVAVFRCNRLIERGRVEQSSVAVVPLVGCGCSHVLIGVDLGGIPGDVIVLIWIGCCGLGETWLGVQPVVLVQDWSFCHLWFWSALFAEDLEGKRITCDVHFGSKVGIVLVGLAVFSRGDCLRGWL